MAQAPANDSVCQAILLPVDDNIYLYNNIGAGIEAGENALEQAAVSGGGDDGWNDPVISVSVWFTFVAPPSGAIEIDLCNDGLGGSNFDTQLAVYTANNCGDFSTFSWLAGNDDLVNCPNPSAFASYLALTCLQAGNLYYLVVDGWSGETGNFGIRLKEIPASPLQVQLQGLDPHCPGGSDGSMIASFFGGGRPYQFWWDTGDTMVQELSNLPAGDYEFFVQDGCDSVRSQSLSLADPVVPLFPDAGPDSSICNEESIRLGGVHTGGVPFSSLRSYSIDLAAGGSLMEHHIQAPADEQTIGSGIGPGIFSADFVEGQLLALSDTWEQLLQVNVDDGSVTVLGSSSKVTSQHIWTGLAFDQSNGILYGLSTDGAQSQLYSIHPGNGTATALVPIALPVPIWLACDTTGRLYTMDIDSDRLYEIDPVSGEASELGATGFDASFAQDADFDPRTNELYLAAYPTGGQGSLLRKADLSSGLCAPIGILAQTTEVGGFALAHQITEPYHYFWSLPLALDNPFVANPISSSPISTQYTLTLTDFCEQQVNDSVSLSVYERPVISLSSDADNGSGNGAIQSVVNGGLPPYQYSWSHGESSAQVTGLNSGWYELLVVDANGCEQRDSVWVDLLNSRESDGKDVQFTIFPNPSSSVFHLTVELSHPQELVVSIGSLSGQELLKLEQSGTSVTQFEVDLSSFPKGVYWLKISTQSRTIYQRISRL